jgi:hypothetical protein
MMIQIMKVEPPGIAASRSFAMRMTGRLRDIARPWRGQNHHHAS